MAFQYTGVFSLNTDGRVNKRNRRPISCSACRSRKSKCDRNQPCGSCHKRGDDTGCNYNTPVSRQQTRPRSEAVDRLQKLEDMINGLIKSSSTHPPVTTPPSSDASKNGSPDLENAVGGHLSAHVEYVDGNHWSTILENVNGIRACIDSEEVDLEPLEPQPKADPIFGPQKQTISIDNIISALPPQQIIDGLLALRSKETFLSLPFVHNFKFQREYNAFCADPGSTNFLWLSLLFSTLFMASKVASARGLEFTSWTSQASQSMFLKRAAECLVAGKYLDPQPRALEALLAYMHCLVAFNGDSSVQPWPLLTLATRLAQRLGYHKEPGRISTKLTPFQSEMRRRAWSWISVFDLTISASLGIPAMINEDDCDCGHPSNLTDEDFDEDSISLTDARPKGSHTHMLFFTFKARLMLNLRPILRHALSNKRHDLEKTNRMHEEFEMIHASCPPVLRLVPIRETSFLTQDFVIMQRLMIRLQYLKGLHHLHRAFLTFDKHKPEYDFSRATCRNAALDMLELQWTYYQEVQSGGRLHDSKWLFNHLTLHEFFPAAMIVCLDLSESLQSPESEASRSRKMEALQHSLQVWSEKKDMCPDAAHASRVLKAMIAKLSLRSSQQPAQGQPDAPAEVVASISAWNSPQTSNQTTTNDTAMDYDFMQNQDDVFEPMDLGSLEDMLNNPDNVDWNTIDNYLIDHAGNVDYLPEQQLFVPFITPEST